MEPTSCKVEEEGGREGEGDEGDTRVRRETMGVRVEHSRGERKRERESSSGGKKRMRMIIHSTKKGCGTQSSNVVHTQIHTCARTQFFLTFYIQNFVYQGFE